MTDPVTPLPLDAIDPHALPRDRSTLDATALSELRASILHTGLRQPIEVLSGAPHALLSGYRRYAAFRSLADDGLDRFATIPAFIRDSNTIPDVLAAMVEENDIRSPVTPWDQARVAVEAVPDPFPTLDAAVARLYRNIDRRRRARIRAAADAVERLDGLLHQPESLSQRQLIRLSGAVAAGYAEVLEHALTHAQVTGASAQWQVLEPVLREAEGDLHNPPRSGTRTSSPRRLRRPRPRLYIRRELAREGWTLRFTGPDATGTLMEEIMDEVERRFGRET